MSFKAKLSTLDIYELPEAFQNYTIFVKNSNNNTQIEFRSNTMLLVQYSEFFAALLKNSRLSNESKHKVTFHSEVITEDALWFILKWMHSWFIEKIRSIPKSINAVTTKIKQKSNLASFISNKIESSEFSLFEHFNALNFLMMKESYL